MKVALYARVSSEKQDVELSISAQLRSLRKYAAKSGHLVVREFVDEAKSGKTTARPAFREMVSAARQNPNPFDAILGNEVYVGTAVWGRDSRRDLPVVRAENAWPAIIAKGAFDQVQFLLRERAPVLLHPKRVASRYLLSGLARCGHCGKALVGQDAKSGRFTYYVCGSVLKKGAGSCPGRYINSGRFERTVTDKIREHVLTVENLTRLVKIVNEESDGLADEHRQRRDRVVEEIADADRRLGRLYDALETGKIQLVDLAPRIQELRQRKEGLQTVKWELEQELSDRYVEVADSDTVAGTVAELRDMLNGSSLVERKAFIRSFVKEVRVIGEEALLTCTMPIAPGGLTEERLPVLSTGRGGGQYWIRTSYLCDVNAAL